MRAITHVSSKFMVVLMFAPQRNLHVQMFNDTWTLFPVTGILSQLLLRRQR